MKKCQEAAIWFHSNHYSQDKYSSFDELLAVGVVDEYKVDDPSEYDKNALDLFLEKYAGHWIIVQVSYEANQLFEQVKPQEGKLFEFPLIYLFVPKQVYIKSNRRWNTSLPSKVFDIFDSQSIGVADEWMKDEEKIEPYVDKIHKLLHEIKIGNIYEINYCRHTSISSIQVNPLELFQRLNRLNAAPFSALYKYRDEFVISASPERFLAKRGSHIIAQPMKGTNRKMMNPEENFLQKRLLTENEKERAENIMIVDLMRNDLAKVCEIGTVKVEELCEVYEFNTVNQMISTISGQCGADKSFADILEALFPMGSMTGAPKVSAMQLIRQFENRPREMFSGSLGYITPDGDFDLNVVIRSILYSDKMKLASISAGGAITFLSDAEEEFQETLLKMETMEKALKDHPSA